MLRVRTVISGFQGGPGLSTNYFDGPVADAASALDAVQRVQGGWGQLREILPLGVSTQTDNVVDVVDETTGDVTGVFVVAAQAALNSNTGFGGMAPPATAMLVSWLTGTFRSGRRVRGRTFISPVAGGVVGAGGVAVAGAVGFVNGYITQVLGLAENPVRAVVWSRPTPTVPGLAAEITSGSVSSKFAVLVSRRD